MKLKTMLELKTMLDERAYMPERAHPDDAGADLRTPTGFTLAAHKAAIIDTGVHVAIPIGYFGKLESKSGLHITHQIVCPGGVIDAGYTGSIIVRLENHSDEDYVFCTGDKIAQLVILPCLTCGFEQVDDLDDTERGTDGFGSTGR